ncbi:pre-mRNA 3'-end-processing factor FIP1 [Stegastes partitus]|uniref:Pre-mRNA 3'-end-processing factor FIP1 n=1 Tax=Stegastes partitus TaxID=144197 RepID=A0A9Y4NI73_9TELE|nr:PREDICTED: pre-mRNA 3'-end-processing factor FIP1 [Stegastes partitus]
MYEVERIQGIQEQSPNVKPLRDKPWRNPGANISDYFNYDFNEKSWIAYCKKQTKLHAASRKLQAKFMVSEVSKALLGPYGHSNDFDGPSTALYTRSSGRIATRARVIDTTKAWEYHARQLKCDRQRDRSREHGDDKENKRGSDREKKRHSSSHNSSGSGRSRRDDDEDKESRHSHKKARRSRKGRESNISADQERKLKSH